MGPSTLYFFSYAVQDDGSVMEHQVHLNRHNNRLLEGVEETNWLDQACSFTQDNRMNIAHATSSTKPLKKNKREKKRVSNLY